MVAGCGSRATVEEDADATSSASDESQSSSTGPTTEAPTHGPDTSGTTGPGTGATTSTPEQDTTTTSEPPDPCAGIAVPQPPFEYDEGHAERVDTDRVSVWLESEGDTEGDHSYRWVFELGPDESAPGVYTVPVEQQCYWDCPNPDFTEDVVIQIFSIGDCLSAAFLEVPEYNCSDFLFGCGGFVEPIE